MQLYIKRIIVYAVVGNVDIHTLYACDSPLKYHVSHFKTLKFLSHGFQREQRGNESSPTEYKGGRGL